ncbi:hypothetical protein UCMB321_1439 [Pseudomonas batumici]|uniref:Uncharacterized protein n=1 Tax=Pseudomonas batumici TaxID=226910 RepID=A0A0C2EFG5_9PSED|nr:hypothetical protein UCMB321_1439 [Pseudomonas batumici]
MALIPGNALRTLPCHPIAAAPTQALQKNTVPPPSKARAEA